MKRWVPTTRCDCLVLTFTEFCTVTLNCNPTLEVQILSVIHQPFLVTENQHFRCARWSRVSTQMLDAVNWSKA